MSRVAATRAVLFAGAAVLGTLGVVVGFGTGIALGLAFNLILILAVINLARWWWS